MLVNPSMSLFILSEKNLRHHAFVLVLQKMAMEERHAANDRIGEVHQKIYRFTIRDIHRIEPHWIFHRLSVDGVGEEVNLVDVKRMHFFG